MECRQVFDLSWRNFSPLVLDSFQRTRPKADVIIGCSNAVGKTLQAHSILLSACSNFFKVLLDQYHDELLSANGRMFVFLKGISYYDMSSVLDLLYHSNISVDEENLDGIHNVLEELEINPSVLGLECNEKKTGSKGLKHTAPKENFSYLEEEIQKVNPIKAYTSSCESMIEETIVTNALSPSKSSQIAMSIKSLNNNIYDAKNESYINRDTASKDGMNQNESGDELEEETKSNDLNSNVIYQMSKNNVSNKDEVKNAVALLSNVESINGIPGTISIEKEISEVATADLKKKRKRRTKEEMRQFKEQQGLENKAESDQGDAKKRRGRRTKKEMMMLKEQQLSGSIKLDANEMLSNKTEVDETEYGEEEVEVLPGGWRKVRRARKSGKLAGHYDTYMYSPEGKLFRSKVELQKYCEENPTITLDISNVWPKKTGRGRPPKPKVHSPLKRSNEPNEISSNLICQMVTNKDSMTEELNGNELLAENIDTIPDLETGSTN